ncbi:hypothetical protein PHYBLDRAFT_173418 [Phycomyces blakesleeanus NRRL 1555(-)]|uniref:Uncharacterized protein n=1 Tax=Phycomyces blakesleeanus (strain ATCC 8743b / DSM 1359 / FGSC 10004 / NBRC 33097 / NRRL 1555) TaxID=763407 RepID=A0A162ZQN4_PHYB8|nr:hypothetical protein PHYBLDRAFT_173418 [Phycomyces blakesleeanus NRRL 1555(-)]OAD68421.1 hypothetical protein PHYBLDRAFT_173418 [Phycomyces blakesleeanus NRRL 1555(-)]|eukprot:XP_018286461.1 hypothetical protein PHYBLDRAFT_173418 [Phycomyces blakesleeanus NRRL 1555(-)]
MLAHEDRTEKLTAVAKRKLQKYQSKKANKTESSESDATIIETENSNLRDQLRQANEKIRDLESQIEINRLADGFHKMRKPEEQFIATLLSDDDLDAYEQEERYIMESAKRRIKDLRERYSQTRAERTFVLIQSLTSPLELCGNCLGDLLEI